MYGHTLPTTQTAALDYLLTFDDTNLETGEMLTMDQMVELSDHLHNGCLELGITAEELEAFCIEHGMA